MPSSVAKVVEITASSPNSFEDAIKSGLGRASETIRGIREAWVDNMKVTVDQGKVTSYRVHMRVTFVLEGEQR